MEERTREEIEAYLGGVPSWIGAIAEPAADHSWRLARDLQFEETELPNREKALVALGAAAAIGCPYCIHFHREEAKLGAVSGEGIAEAVNVAADIRYFSTVLHGAEVDLDEFVEETAGIVDHIEEQRANAADAD
ncbi:carboxymuconolactone decarboxylase family protein [Natronorarus salvus]|uniref:carboxymuconolactone decarboxylase family protein n=1 Tax=Natronorarus salvus TaxID=3117733 RepID=UPI002F266DF9